MKVILWYLSLLAFPIFSIGCGGCDSGNANTANVSTNTSVKTNGASSPLPTQPANIGANTATTTNSNAAQTTNSNTVTTNPTPVNPQNTPSKQEEGQFSFPPPRATDFTIKRELAVIPLKNFFAELEAKLKNAGYRGENNYTHFSHGSEFALVTRLEQINEDGTPLSGSIRWTEFVPPANSFASYTNYLLKGKRAYFRSIAFVVSQEEFNPLRGLPPAFETVKGWMITGNPFLVDTGPGSVAGQETVLNEKYKCYVLIYIFEKHTSEDAVAFRDSFPISAEQQLKQMNIVF